MREIAAPAPIFRLSCRSSYRLMSKLKTLSALQALAAGTAGAVISFSVSSSSGESAETVLKQLREAASRISVLLAFIHSIKFLHA